MWWRRRRAATTGGNPSSDTVPPQEGTGHQEMMAQSGMKDDDPQVLTFSDDRLHVTIEQPTDGFFSSVRVVAKVPLPPKKVFDILTDTENRSIFRSIKKVNYRKVLKDNGHGNKKVEVEHIGRWKFGVFHGEFTVRLMVHQDRNKGRIRFDLMPIRNNFMKNFSGEWSIEPYDEDALDELVRYPGRKWGSFHSLKKAVHRLEHSLISKERNSLVQLRQSVAPAMLPPPPLDRVLKRITLTQVKAILGDLLDETHRVHEQEKLEQEKKKLDRAGIFTFARNHFMLSDGSEKES